MGLFEFGTYMNTRDTARYTRRNNSELRKANRLAREAARRDAERDARTAAADDRDLQYRLATDSQFRAWYQAEELAKVKAAAAARLAKTRRKDEARARRRKDFNFGVWVLGLVLIPWLVVWLPYTRERVTGGRYWLLVAWALFIIMGALAQIIIDPSSFQ